MAYRDYNEIKLSLEKKEMDKLELKRIQKRLNILYKRKDKLEDEIDNLESKLVRLCDCSDYEIKEEYIEGSYLETTKGYKFKKCKVCGKTFDKVQTYQGSYA